MTARCPFGGGGSRRAFLGGGALLAAAAGHARADEPANREAKGITPQSQLPARDARESFTGPHQAGILTPLQNHTYFAAFDLVATDRAQVIRLLRDWTTAAARLTGGETGAPLGPPDRPGADAGDAIGLGAARLTLTFGFGAGLFEHDGIDRYGLRARRPEAFVDLPVFHGDQLEPARTGGDLSVQACADDPQVAFHAIRHLARTANGVARLRWTQTGFAANAAANDTPRNLMGFKDGTQNPLARPPVERSAGVATDNPGPTPEVVWAGPGAGWMADGSYLVIRRIRMALEHWDDTEVEFQEQTIGRHKYSGAPLGRTGEFDELDLDATDADGNLVIPDNAHVRLAAAASNDGAQILRRSYSYNDGVNITAERWPPWRQGLEYDAGLLFVCYQSDPRAGFVRIFDAMAKMDALNQYVTHTGGGLFAIPPGVAPGGFIGQSLMDA